MTQSDTRADIAQLLHDLNGNAPGSLDRFASFVQAELRQLAASYLRREWANESLQPTELVNECYLRLFGGTQPHWNDKAHFFGFAAQSMRHILVDRARRRGALKRPDHHLQLPLDGLDFSSPGMNWQILAIHQALEKLQGVDPRLVRVIELRIFAGMSVSETASVMGLSAATIKREWTFALAWLHRELS